MEPDAVDDTLTFLITPHAAHTDSTTRKQHNIVLSVDRNGSNKLHYTGAYVVPGWGPTDPPLPAHVGDVSLEEDIVLEEGQQGALICAYLLPESSMPTKLPGESRYPPLPLGLKARPQRPARDLAPARVYHLSGPAAAFPGGLALEPWTQLLVEVGGSQLLWPGGMQRVQLGPEGEAQQWQKLDPVRDKDWIINTRIEGMLRWFSPDDDSVNYYSDEDEDEVKDYCGRFPYVLEVLGEVRPFIPEADPEQQPELFPALVVEICMPEDYAQHVTGFIDVDGVRYYQLDEEAGIDVRSQLHTNIIEADAEARTQLDAEEEQFKEQQQQQEGGG